LAIDNDNAFVAQFDESVLGDEWQPVDKDSDTAPATDDVKFRRTQTTSDTIHVVVRKYNGEYSLWIDGRKASSSSQNDGSIVYQLPSYKTYYEHVDRAGKRVGGVSTPVCISVLVENGQRGPDSVNVETRQELHVNGAVVQNDVIGEQEIEHTNESSPYGRGAWLCYPHTYVQRPYVQIRDVSGERVQQMKTTQAFFTNIVRLIGGAVLGAAVSYGVVYATAGATVASFASAAVNIPALRPLTTIFENNPDFTSGSLSGMLSAGWQFGGVRLAALGLTTGTLLNWYIAIGMTNAIWSFSQFVIQMNAQHQRDTGTVPDPSIQQQLFEEDPTSDLLNLMGATGWEDAQLNGWDWILKQGMTWIATNALRNRSTQSVKVVRYTLREVTSVLRGISTSSATSIMQLGLRERTLVDWMIEPSTEDENIMWRATRGVVNWVGRLFTGKQVIVRSGKLLAHGLRLSTLRKHTMQIKYEIVVVDSHMCQNTPIRFTVVGDGAIGTRGGLLESGFVEDFDECKREIENFVVSINEVGSTWRVINTIFGFPSTMIDAVLGTNIRKAYNEPIIKQSRDKLIRGGTKLLHELIFDSFLRLRTLAKTRTYSSDLIHVTSSSTTRCFRTLPQRIIPYQIQIASPAPSRAPDLSYDVMDIGADSASDISIVDNASNPISAAHELKNVVAAASHAHSTAARALRDFVAIWQHGPTRVVFFQLWECSDDTTSVPKLVCTNPFSTSGLELSAVRREMLRIPSKSTPSLPMDVTFRAIESLHNSTDVEKHVVGLVARADPGAVSTMSELFGIALNSVVSNTVTNGLADIVVRAFLDRAKMDEGMAIMHSLESVVQMRLDATISFIETMDKTLQGGIPHKDDISFLALPGGREAYGLLHHMGIFDNSVLHVWKAKNRDGIVSSANYCREITSVRMFRDAVPQLLESYIKPREYVHLLNAVRDGLKTARSVTDKASKLSRHPAVQNVTTMSDDKRRAMLIDLMRVSSVVGRFSTDADEQVRIRIALVSSLPFLETLSIAEQRLLQAAVPPVILQPDPYSYDRSIPLVSHANLNLPVPTAARIYETMKLRVCKHTIEVGHLVRSGNAKPLTTTPPPLASLESLFYDHNRAIGDTLYIPFGAGDGLTHLKFPKERLHTFSSFPVALDVLAVALQVIRTHTANAAPGALQGNVFISDVSLGKGIDTPRSPDALVRDPLYIDVDTYERPSSSTVSHSSYSVPRRTVAWVYMSNRLSPRGSEDTFDPSNVTNTVAGVVQFLRTSNLQQRNVSTHLSELQWNCERIVQATYTLLGKIPPTNSPSPLRIHVRTPREWIVSREEIDARQRLLDDAIRELNRHTSSRDYTVEWVVDNVWDAVLNLSRGLVRSVEAAVPNITGEVDTAGVPQAVGLVGALLFGPAQVDPNAAGGNAVTLGGGGGGAREAALVNFLDAANVIVDSRTLFPETVHEGDEFTVEDVPELEEDGEGEEVDVDRPDTPVRIDDVTVVPDPEPTPVSGAPPEVVPFPDMPTTYDNLADSPLRIPGLNPDFTDSYLPKTIQYTVTAIKNYFDLSEYGPEPSVAMRKAYLEAKQAELEQELERKWEERERIKKEWEAGKEARMKELITVVKRYIIGDPEASDLKAAIAAARRQVPSGSAVALTKEQQEWLDIHWADGTWRIYSESSSSAVAPPEGPTSTPQSNPNWRNVNERLKFASDAAKQFAYVGGAAYIAGVVGKLFLRLDSWTNENEQLERSVRNIEKSNARWLGRAYERVEDANQRMRSSTCVATAIASAIVERAVGPDVAPVFVVDGANDTEQCLSDIQTAVQAAHTPPGEVAWLTVEEINHMLGGVCF